MIRKLRVASGIALVLFASSPAFADVKAGVDAWGRGDYPTALKEWRGPAIAGDADAQFNLGQAYKLGRGVPIDLKLAEDWYRKAAAQGHLQAEDNYGLILFQNGDRQRALPLIERSANRGEPRAQYVYGTALFNGDLISKDWPRAYALMTRASAAGLGPASSSLAQMDKYIPIDQRQRGLAIARELETRAARPQMAINDAPALPRAPAVPSYPPVPSYDAPQPLPVPQTLPAEVRMPKESRLPKAVREEAMPPSKSWRTDNQSALPRPMARGRTRPVEPEMAQEAATAQQMPDTFPQDSYPQAEPLPPVTDDIGARYPQQEAYPAEPMPRPPVVRQRPAPAPAPVIRKAVPTPRATTGAYRVQLGAFSDAGRAKALWSSLAGNVSGLKGMQPYLVKAGSITRLQAGPVSSKAGAEQLCNQVRSAAQSCLVVAP
jgi:uncharacterized protein